jgi:cyclic beta-1,2-glucan synthetase
MSDATLDALLAGDPAGAYGISGGITKARLRAAALEIGRWSGRSVEDVARRCVELAVGAGRDRREAHVGYYLDDDGRRELERAVGASVPLGRSLGRVARAIARAAYVPSIFLVAAAILAGVAWTSLAPDGWLRWVVIAALAPAATFVGWIAVETIIAVLVFPPRPLPRLDLSGGIPAEFRTLVVNPVIVASAEDVRETLAAMRANAQANDDPELRFCLLTDFVDADAETRPGEDEVLAEIGRSVAALNAEVPSPAGPRFHHFHRRRRWNPREERWIAWERKRGKLAEFNRLIGGATDTSYLPEVGDRAILAGVRYVITLDADTGLPPGVAAQLVGALAHPLNRARWDAKGRMVAGYTFIQPRVHVVVARGEGGFTEAVFGTQAADVNELRPTHIQDLFGYFYFFGKGIYDVAAFERNLGDTMPDNWVLSDDKLEGWLGRSVHMADAPILEEPPKHQRSWRRRQHRWVRSDFQLLPWVLPRVPTRSGRWAPNRLGIVPRWAILADSVIHTRPIGLLVAIVAAWLGGVADAWVSWHAWLALLLFSFGSPLIPILVLLTRRLDGLAFDADGRPRPASLPPRGQLLAQRVKGNVMGTALYLVFLVDLAALNADAFVRAMYRMIVSKRHLLQWSPSAANRRATAGQGALAVWAELWKVVAICAAVAGALALVRPPLRLLWLASPQIAYLLSPREG